MHLKRKISEKRVQFIGSDYSQTEGRLSIRNYFLAEIGLIRGDERICVACSSISGALGCALVLDEKGRDLG
jgi:hypothetical protein